MVGGHYSELVSPVLLHNPQMLNAHLEEQKMLTTMIRRNAAPSEANAFEMLLDSDAVRTAEQLDASILSRGAAAVDPTEGPHYFATYSVWIDETYPLLETFSANLEVYSQQIVVQCSIHQAIQLSACVLCLALTLVMGLSSVQSIARPFAALSKAAVRLERESCTLKMHKEVTEHFIPKGTLRLMGVRHITQLERGQAKFRRMTVMTGDIVGFTALASQQTPESVFKSVCLPVRQAFRREGSGGVCV